jgi:tryptophan synthase alpha chain
VTYVAAGFPTAASSRDALHRAAEAGADVLELGLPFSDPLADGPTIQRAAQVALDGGMTVARALALLAEAAVPVPVVLMTYLNPVLAYGLARFAADARAAGASGVLLTDLPAGADPGAEAAVRGAGLDLIRLVAPTTPDARLAPALAGAGGFVYLISRLGVTGMRDDLPPDLAAHVARLRAVTTLPIAAGFGIGTPGQARAAARVADGVIVGSAVVDALGRDGPAGVATLVARLATAVREARS